MEISEFHGQNCAGNLKMKNIHQRGHVLSTKFQCEEKECKHIFLWSSSPYLPNNDYLINNRVNHSFLCSGMLPSHYTRFVDGAGIGKISKQNRQKYFNDAKKHIQKEYEDSIYKATLEEVA